MLNTKDLFSKINKRSHFLILSTLFLVINTITYSQYIKHKFERLTVKDGLAAPTVYHAIQDRTGFLWFATSNGLSKYDGYNFITYRHNPDNPNGLSQNTCIYLFEDNEGKIWIVNNGNVGIDRYDPVYDKFDNFRHNPEDSNSLSHNNVYHVMQDSKGKIWICTDNALNLIVKGRDNISFRSFLYPESANNYFGRAHENKDNLFILFSDSVFYFDRETLQYISAGIKLRTHQINSLAEDKNGNIYLGTTNTGIIKLEYNSATKTYKEVVDYDLNLVPDKRSFVLVDDKDQIWLGTETQGLYNYNPETKNLLHFINDEQDEYSLSDNSVHSLFIDRNGILWIGTVSEGLCKYDLYTKKFYHYRSIADNINSLGGNLMSSLHSISSQELWVGSRGDGGVSRIIFDENENPRFIHYKNDPENDNSIPSNNILCLVQRKNGDVWVGSGSIRLSRIILENSDLNMEPVIENYTNRSWTFSIFEDSEGILWGGTWGAGLWRYNDLTKQFTYYTNNPDDSTSICDNVVWAIYEDMNRNIWIGGNKNGISILTADQKHIENPKFINLSYIKENPTSLSSNMINAFYQDTRGTMWVATIGGLNKVINSTTSIQKIKETKSLNFKSYTVEDGLPSDAIQGIVEDLKHNLWLSTSNGVSFFNLKDTTFINYFESDGLQSDEFWHNSYFVNSKGRVFFGGKNGISAFYPKDIQANPFVPQIALTDLKIFNKSVKVGDKINNDVILQKSFNESSEIVLSYKNNVITIEFAALHFTQPYKNQYAYYLEGFEDDWNYLENIRSTTYTNLDPGKYTFRVKGSNNNGVWNEKGKSIVIRVKAPWWKTWLFRISAIVMIALIVYYAFRMRMNMMKREKEMLRKKLNEGEHELQLRKNEIEKHKQEIEEQNSKEFEIRYLHMGISKFAEMISKMRKNLDELSKKLVIELVKYTETNIGVIYLVDDSDPKNIKLINAGSYCFDSEKIKKQVFMPGEGYVGTCYKDKEIIQINDLPDGYVLLRSGLGSTSIRHSLLVPILSENICLGVIELASVDTIESYKIDFITKLVENYASVIAINTVNMKMQEMLEQNKIQAKELIAQEEKLRQNLEEMQATQEELKKQMEVSNNTKEKMLFEKTLTDALLENARESIYFKDIKSRFLKVSRSMTGVFNVKKVEDIYGKTDFDFFTNEHARPAYKDEQNIIKTGTPIFDKVEKETHADGRISYVTTTKMPLKDSKGKIIGTFGISKNITELVELKQDLEKREKEMADKKEKIVELQKEIKQKEAIIKKMEDKLKK